MFGLVLELRVRCRSNVVLCMLLRHHYLCVRGSVIMCRWCACCLFPIIPLGLWWMVPFCVGWKAYASSLCRCAGCDVLF